MLEDARQLLAERFGFADFKDGQADVVKKLLEGKSVLAIFPTGGGKSICYQLPALMLDGVTLVISPLIALMKDQIDFLIAKGVAAARLDSTIGADDARATFKSLRDGTLKLLYVAPERLNNERFLSTIAQQQIALLAVDEAHCISEWGHNFRPDYLKLARVAKQLKVGRVLALTATAPPAVAAQVADAFEIEPADIVRTGFYRSNLSLKISPTTPAQRDALLVERIKSRPQGAAVVYVTLQKTAEHVASLLSDAGLNAEAYHAGLKAEDRSAIQDRFMDRGIGFQPVSSLPDEGQHGLESRATGNGGTKIVVATIAFGMGIDKRDIRAVYHYNLPKSLENYAQEVGRAGRDGLPSMCEMLACVDDRVTLENFTFGDTPTREAIDSLTREIMSQPESFDVSSYELSGRHDIRQLVVETLLTYLQLEGLIESVGAFYNEYKFIFAKPMEEVFAGFDAKRVAFLQRMFGEARKSKAWSHIDLHAAAANIGEPRDRLVAALNYLAEQGSVELEVAGVRQAYRRVKTLKEGELVALVDDLDGRFADREQRDVERLDSVIELADENACIAQRLAAYFGEQMDAPCGHCSACLGEFAPLKSPKPTRPLGEAEVKQVEELLRMQSPALRAPRQVARFLCGLPSPAISRARLGKHTLAAAWAHVPFQDALEFIDAMRDA